ncbi:predicted protein [Nematostella vectensis]|uniref:C-type lectin domain-containing protein n=1 Tax=Nematostella vectensis TaxID=45351 RepID=A7SVE5_NEMVE|nr:predicted protein [Nematostella vectensis]|eukprot:XP_001624409.1 predicted protein [Nematostella vectensis]
MPVTRAQADEACRRLGSELVEISDNEEQEFVYRNLVDVPRPVGVWTGLIRSAETDEWSWNNRTAPTFFYWGYGEPNNYMSRGENCSEMRYWDGMWNDVLCVNKYGYVCEKAIFVTQAGVFSSNIERLGMALQGHLISTIKTLIVFAGIRSLDIAHGFRGASFVPYPSLRLLLPSNHTERNKTEFHASDSQDGCLYACVRRIWCFSTNVNLTALRHGEKRQSCELLPTNTFSTPSLENDSSFMHFSIKKRGHNIVAMAIDGSGIYSKAAFDTWGNKTAGSSMSKHIQNIPDNSVVIIATKDSADVFVNDAYSELQSLGVVAPLQPGHRESWLLIGYKGGTRTWITQRYEKRFRGPSKGGVLVPKEGCFPHGDRSTLYCYP